jgi:isocitrate/isopropylmalate dehydrogenase
MPKQKERYVVMMDERKDYYDIRDPEKEFWSATVFIKAFGGKPKALRIAKAIAKMLNSKELK